MNRWTLLNVLALALAIVLATAFGRGDGQDQRTWWRPALAKPLREIASATNSAGSVFDATGSPVAVRAYHRIVSTNPAADRLLVELAEPDRVLAYSAASVARPRDGYRFAGKAGVDGFGSLEGLIALQPDLVLTSSFGRPHRTAALRAADVAVFDLGELRGTASVVAMAESLAQLLDRPERGEHFARSFTERMERVAAKLGDRPRKRALYLSAVGGSILGGTTGTALHDILVAGGLLDVAASRFRDWPRYSAEDLVILSPDLVVTKEGMSAAVCAHPGAARTSPCRKPDAILEIPGELLDEAGPAMLEAAEMIFRMAYP